MNETTRREGEWGGAGRGGWENEREGGREGGRGVQRASLRVEENETAKDGQKGKQARLQNKAPEEKENA